MEPTDAPDPRRWISLAIVVTAVLIVAMDNTILNVSLPSIQRDLDSTLSSVQWVVTGYSLTFATLLIIGGRLGDIYGPRRTFIVGASIFAGGSLLASLAASVPVLVIGEAVIEGCGASLMLPATLAILSTTFQGRERAVAFAAWGATAGLAVAIGPMLGGFLTTTYSWRWSLRINVIVAPLAALGAYLVFRRDAPPQGRRQRIDVPGALLVASGTFLLVFGLTESTRVGWGKPTSTFTLLGWDVWPVDRPVSLVPIVFVLAFALLGTFVVVERRKEREDRDPLFEMSQLRFLTFRYGLLTTAVLAMGQLSFLLILPVFLQESQGLSAQTTGEWLAPMGIFIIIGAQVGGRLTAHFGPTRVVRVGLALEAVGLALMAFSIAPGMTFLAVLPSLVVFGIGIGFASSQLTSVVLTEIDDARAGAAGGANTTVRQIGSALGVAIAASLFVTAADPADGARLALFVAAVQVAFGTCLSFLIPIIGPEPAHPAADIASAVDPIAPDGSALLEQT